jgi:hypothetical protein
MCSSYSRDVVSGVLQSRTASTSTKLSVVTEFLKVSMHPGVSMRVRHTLWPSLRAKTAVS